MSLSPLRRPFTFLIALGCCLQFAFPQWTIAKHDLDRFDLRGAVRTVVTRYAQLTTTHQFDRDGRLTAFELQPVIQAGAVRFVYRYDASGRLIEEETFDPEGAAYQKTFRYAFNDQGRPSAQVVVTDQGLFTQAAFSFYDHRGLLSEEIMVNAQEIGRAHV